MLPAMNGVLEESRDKTYQEGGNSTVKLMFNFAE